MEYFFRKNFRMCIFAHTGLYSIAFLVDLMASIRNNNKNFTLEAKCICKRKIQNYYKTRFIQLPNR